MAGSDFDISSTVAQPHVVYILNFRYIWDLLKHCLPYYCWCQAKSHGFQKSRFLDERLRYLPGARDSLRPWSPIWWFSQILRDGIPEALESIQWSPGVWRSRTWLGAWSPLKCALETLTQLEILLGLSFTCMYADPMFWWRSICTVITKCLIHSGARPFMSLRLQINYSIFVSETLSFLLSFSLWMTYFSTC